MKAPINSTLVDGTAICNRRVPASDSNRSPESAESNTRPAMRHDQKFQGNHEIIVSGLHLELTPALKALVYEKTERLFRRTERIVRIRVELGYDPKEALGTRFKAKGHIVIDGPDMNAAAEADECNKAILLLIDKLDRMLARRHQRRRAQHQDLHALELDASSPKAVETASVREIEAS